MSRSDPKMLLVKFEGEEATEVAFADFAADNAEDGYMLSRLAQLKVGESAKFGGGAAPVVVIEVCS